MPTIASQLKMIPLKSFVQTIIKGNLNILFLKMASYSAYNEIRENVHFSKLKGLISGRFVWLMT